MKNKIGFFLNGKLQELDDHQLGFMLSDYLRYEQGLTGTKVVCAEGDCGACSVLRYNPLLKGEDSSRYSPINSCIIPVVCLHGSHILTIEAIEKEDRLHESQRAVLDNHGTQCGFCTPGIIIGLAGLCEEKLERGEKRIEVQEAKNSLTGNLCRCTGYQSIIEAAQDIKLENEISLKERYPIGRQLKKLSEESVYVETENFSFFAPTTYKEAFEYINNHKNIRLISSGTDLGVVHNKRKIKLTRLMSLHLIKESYQISENTNTIHIGARATITDIRHFLKTRLKEYAEYIDLFASPQIKNNATLVGNIANASPIGDNAPALLALDAQLTIESINGGRVIPLSQFFLGYKKTDLKKNELITQISFKIPKGKSFQLFKNSLRKDLDIATVNMAFQANIQKKVIHEILIAAGGLAAIPLRLTMTEKFLKGKNINSIIVEEACKIAQSEFQPLSDVRASSAYRRILVSNYIKRFLSSSLEAQA
jgi:xanthine dehydrogenase small subunit